MRVISGNIARKKRKAQVLKDFLSDHQVFFRHTLNGTNCFAEIDVLVLFTPDALNWFSVQTNPWQALITIAQGNESVNLAFANSEIFNKQIRYRSEMFDFQNYNTSPFNLFDMVDDLQDLEVDASDLREQR